MEHRPHPRHVVNNWRTYEGSFSVKLRLAMKNSAIKVRKASNCCGNHGEPGC